MTPLSLKARLLYGFAAAAMLAATPVKFDLHADGWTVLKPAYAWAKDGDDDDDDDSGGGRSGSGSGSGSRGGSDDRSGSDDSGGDRGGSRGGSDDRSGSDDSGGDRGGSRGGSDDSADDDDDDSGQGRGRGRGGDDRSGSDDSDDDNSGRGRGGDDDRAGSGSGSGGGSASGGAKVEISRSGIEVERADGTKEEIENGRYERKDASGRTVEERPATQADIDRLRGFAGPGVVAATRRVGSGAAAKVEITRTGIEVLNADGTKEEIENGRYERKNAAGRTIEERPATQADVDRLQSVARDARPVRRFEVGSVSKVERSAAGVEIVYSTGWKEELQNGRYELKDPNGATVIERPATARDRDRLTRLAGA